MQNGLRTFDISKADRAAITNKGTEIMSVMRLSHAGMLALTVALCSAGTAFAQSAPSSAPVKTIGAPAAAKSEVVPSLIVLNSRGATLQGDVLTLTATETDDAERHCFGDPASSEKNRN